MLYEIAFDCISHVGRRRTTNQDNYICNGRYIADENDSVCHNSQGFAYPGDDAVFGVFDGMGGLSHGETASRIAAQNACMLQLGDNAIDSLDRYCHDTNFQICQSNRSASGTTAALLAFTRKEIALCNIGDSKIFRITRNSIEQISKDHIATIPGTTQTVLTQNLGIPVDCFDIRPHFARGCYSSGDIYLICSDGLTDMLDIDEIHHTVIGAKDENAAEQLLQKALAAGGNDNISIILCRIKHRNFFRSVLKGKSHGKRIME